MDTSDLVKRFDRLADAVQAIALDSAEKRHAANGATNGVILAIQNATEAHALRIDVLEKTAKETSETLVIVKDMATTIQALSDRMVGNDKMKTEGLVQEVKIIRIDVDNLKEGQRETTAKVQAVRYVVLVIGMLGAVVTWLQTTGFLQIFARAH